MRIELRAPGTTPWHVGEVGVRAGEKLDGRTVTGLAALEIGRTIVVMRARRMTSLRMLLGMLLNELLRRHVHGARMRRQAREADSQGGHQKHEPPCGCAQDASTTMPWHGAHMEFKLSAVQAFSGRTP